MDVNALRSRVPSFLKAVYRYVHATVPYGWRHGGRAYRETRALLAQSGHWSAAQLAGWQNRELARVAVHAVRHAPYYRALFARLELDPESLAAPETLARLPFLDRSALARHARELASDAIPRRRLIYQTTGGTSGQPIPLLGDRVITLQRDRAFWDAFLERFGLSPADRMITLRNDVLAGGRLWDYSPKTRRLVLDAFKLAPGNVGQYLDAIAASGIAVLYTYPSAAAALLTLARQAGVMRRLPIRWIVATSENVYPGQRAFLEDGYGARFITMYGQSERVIFAGECERSEACHVNPEYGRCELVDEGGRVITEPGVRGELVGTGFINDALPLFRYRTGDYAEYAAEQSCPCGRAYPLLTRVTGRWLQELVLKPDGGVVSITALNMHSGVFDRCRQFQFVQAERDALTVRVVPSPGFGPDDEAAIRRVMGAKLGPAMNVEIVRVEEIPRTAMGKQRFLVQQLELPPGVGAP